MENCIAIIRRCDNDKIIGEIHFKESIHETHIFGIVSELSEGLHGFHIHRSGHKINNCGDLCSHYNPHDKNHGGRTDENRHLGDLGNIYADNRGMARINIRDKSIRLFDKYGIVGRSIIIHEGKDDLGLGNNKDSKTTGNSGKRFAYGIIIVK